MKHFLFFINQSHLLAVSWQLGSMAEFKVHVVVLVLIFLAEIIVLSIEAVVCFFVY